MINKLGLDFVVNEKFTITLKRQDIKKLEKVFTVLEKKSGLIIDPYGKSKISPDHSKILLEGIFAQKVDFPEFVRILKYSVKNSEWIHTDGD